MTRLAQVQAHIRAVTELLDIVGAMRSLARMRVQEAQKALPGIRSYALSVANAIGSALQLLPDTDAGSRLGGARRAVIVFLAEHGFAGGFNEHLAKSVEAQLQARDMLFVLGRRGAATALERGWEMAWSQPMATRVASAAETAQSLVNELYRRIARGEISSIEAQFARFRQGAAPEIEQMKLLPIDLAALRVKPASQPPLHNLDPRTLLEKLIGEYIFALLTEAVVESLASENAARFAAMDSAHENVSKKLDQLRLEARRARQADITTELLELVTGAEASGTAYGASRHK
jgi:F-type H+-transporting ATPase subunit gamma